MAKSAKRTILPYFIFVGIGMVVHLLNGHCSLFTREMLKQIFVTCMPDLTYTGAGWFLISLFFADIWMYIWLKYFSSFAREAKVLLLALLYVFSASILSLNKSIGIERLPFRIDCSFMSFFFMICGYYIRQFKILERFFSKKLYALFIFLAYFPVMKVNGWVNLANCAYYNPCWYFVESISGTLFLLCLSFYISKWKTAARILSEIGKTTLPLFLMHGMFLSFMITTMNIKCGVDVVKPMSFLYAVILLIVTYPLGKLYMTVMKKIKSFVNTAKQKGEKNA